MCKASKWFKALLGFKKNDSSSSTYNKKWSDVKSYKDQDFQQQHHHDKSHYMNGRAGVDPTIHSSVTTSSVIRTTTVTTWNGEEWAAVVIQSHFRAYLVSYIYILCFCFILCEGIYWYKILEKC